MAGRWIGSDRVAALLLACLLFWLPLPAGSVTPLGELIFRLGAVSILALTVLAPGARLERRRLLAAAALTAVAGLGFVQSCRWPAPAARLVSPRHVELYGQAAALAGESPRVYLSLNPQSSRASALAWLAAAALLVACGSLGTSARNRRIFAAVLLLAPLVQGVVSVVHAGRAGGVLGGLLRPEGRFHGTFANSNHLALLGEIGLALALAWVWLSAGGRQATWLRRLVGVLPAALTWLALLALVVLTGSRGGIVAAAAGTLAQLLALLVAGRRRQAMAVGLMILLALGGLAVVGAAKDIQRYASVSLFEDNLRSRFEVLAPSIELWQRFLVTGTGLGTFEDAFTLVSPAELSRDLWDRAHNNWVELLVTGGLVGFSLAAAAALALLARIWQVLRRGRRLEERAAALAAVGAMAAAGAHELLDFGLVIPANAAALIVVVGMAAAVPLNRLRPAEGSPRRAPTTRRSDRTPRAGGAPGSPATET